MEPKVKMKAGIITFHNALNYGAILQAYALQTTLENLGCSARILDYSNFYVKTELRKPQLSDYHNPLKYQKDSFIYKTNVVKKDKIQNFVDQYLHLSEPLDKKCIGSYAETLDIVFTGSDQVWNDDITRNDDTYYLDFVPREKRYSYAASLGRSFVSQENVSRVYNLLRTFSGISVREKQAQESLMSQMGIESTTVLDPTLLLSRECYNGFIKKNNETKYVLLYMLLYSDSLIEKAKRISERLKCPVYCVNSSGKPVRGFVDYSDSGIEEWLSLFAGAEYVLTNSFHGTAFSVNFNKQFVVELPPAKIKANSRITDFLSMVGLEDRVIVGNEIDSFLKMVDFTSANTELNREKEKSIQFLRDSIENKVRQRGPIIDKSVISISAEQCCGCGVCTEVCRCDALVMASDEKGFARPTLNPAKCVNCGACKNACVFEKKSREPKTVFDGSVFAASYKGKEVLKNSSSGGMFYAIAESVLSENGTVYGVAFDEAFYPVYRRITDIKDIKPLMGSKYAQANAFEAFAKVKQDLNEHLRVLFVGTPCQVAAARQLFGTNQNLLLVDFVCHGVPSPKMVPEHIEYIEKKTGKKVVEYLPRVKVMGWGHNETFKYSDGSVEYRSPISQAYKEIFHLDLSIRSSCFNCPFTSFNRPGDLTIADFWGLERNHPELCSKDGISMVLVSTEKGRQLIDKLQTINRNEVAITDIPEEKQPHLFRPLSLDKNRNDMFWNLYQRYGWEYVCRKYARCDRKSLIKWRIKQSKLYKLTRGRR